VFSKKDSSQKRNNVALIPGNRYPLASGRIRTGANRQAIFRGQFRYRNTVPDSGIVETPLYRL
jgi:hypothetical protein